MNKSKCPVCKSFNTIKYGVRNGIQTYRCNDCGYRFRNTRLPPDEQLWKLYLENKQTVSELSELMGVSASTIKRRLKNISCEWRHPDIDGGRGFVHLDATYWGHNWGVMAAIEAESGRALYISFIRNETVADYQDAVRSIGERGYNIRGIIIDGKKSLFSLFSSYRIQMCQFHMKQIIRRYLTNNPRLNAAKDLLALMDTLTTADKDVFCENYNIWKETYRETLNRRTVLKSGRTQYTHKRLRSAMNSLDFFLPYLFTCQHPQCAGMPNTNNKIEGTFTDLKRNLNNHSGMPEENRKRFICGFFLALNESLDMKRQDPR